MTNIEAKHENGYSGKLYGKSSMIIFDETGKEVLHTGFRDENIQTEQDLLEQLGAMPEFLKLLFSEAKHE